jgi:hypothetical protein
MSDDRIDNLYQDSRPPVQETLTLPAAVLMQTGAESAREEVTHELNSQAQ